MKIKRVATIFALSLLAASIQARALSLQEAAALALQNDPRLRAAGQEVQSTAADVDVARAGYLPSASLNLNAGLTRYYLSPELSQSISLPGALNPNSATLHLSQPLYSGGQTSAQLQASKSQLENSQQNENQAREQLLLDASATYLDVVRDRAVVQLNAATVAAVQQSLSDTQKRFNAGEATRTDVAQASARLAQAQAGLKRADANQRINEATFLRVVGVPAEQLSSGWPAPKVPASLDEALASAGLTPAVLAADAQRRSAEAQVAVARADYWPKLSFDGQAFAQKDTKFATEDYQDWSVQLKATLPLYEGGARRARVSAAQARAAAAAAKVEDAQHAAVEAITQTWAQLAAADEVSRAYESEVEASQLALDNVRKEHDVGTRTTLDLLDAERDLLSAQVNLASSRRDRAVAALQLLAVCGKLRLEDIPSS